MTLKRNINRERADKREEGRANDPCCAGQQVMYITFAHDLMTLYNSYFPFTLIQ